MAQTPRSNHDSRITNHASQSRQLKLRGGRRLGVSEFGAPGGRPILYCHGFPGSRLDARLGEEAAARLGVRLIAPDRPGYGLSDFQPGRRIPDWASDMVELADSMSLDRFALLGISGGGPYAIACAAALPGRITRVGVVCGLGRLDIPGNTARLNLFARSSFALARRAPGVSRLFNSALAPLLRNSPRWTLRLLAAKLPPPDLKVLSDPRIFAVFADAFREGLRQGGRGVAHDLALYAAPWETALDSIRVPCFLWHGEQDTTVPVEMGRWLANAVPGCRAKFLPAEGHFSLPAQRMDEILAALT